MHACVCWGKPQRSLLCGPRSGLEHIGRAASIPTWRAVPAVDPCDGLADLSALALCHGAAATIADTRPAARAWRREPHRGRAIRRFLPIHGVGDRLAAGVRDGPGIGRCQVPRGGLLQALPAWQYAFLCHVVALKTRVHALTRVAYFPYDRLQRRMSGRESGCVWRVHGSIALFFFASRVKERAVRRCKVEDRCCRREGRRGAGSGRGGRLRVACATRCYMQKDRGVEIYRQEKKKGAREKRPTRMLSDSTQIQ
jgi:hypothetical protein